MPKSFGAVKFCFTLSKYCKTFDSLIRWFLLIPFDSFWFTHKIILFGQNVYNVMRIKDKSVYSIFSIKCWQFYRLYITGFDLNSIIESFILYWKAQRFQSRSDGKAPVLELLCGWSISLLPLHPNLVSSDVVIPFSIPSIIQIYQGKFIYIKE